MLGSLTRSRQTESHAPRKDESHGDFEVHIGQTGMYLDFEVHLTEGGGFDGQWRVQDC